MFGPCAGYGQAGEVEIKIKKQQVSATSAEALRYKSDEPEVETRGGRGGKSIRKWQWHQARSSLKAFVEVAE